MKHYLRFMITLILTTVWCMGGYAQTTVEQKSFTAVSADNISNDKNVSYSTAKGGGTVNPTVKNNQIYLYQKASGKNYGGTITIEIANGYTLKSVTIGSSMKTNVAYTVDDATSLSSSNSLSANGKFTVKDLNASSITFYCMGTSSSARLYVNYLSVTYTSPAPTTTTFGSTVDNKTFTIVKGGDFPQYTATATNENGEKVEGTFEYTSSNDSYVTVDKTTGQTAAGTAFGESVITATFTPTDATAYKSSSAFYSINYKDAKASLSFSESSATVVYGKETEFIAPTLTLLDAEGNEVKGQSIIYGAETEGVVDVDIETGKITRWIKPGTTKVTAIVDGGDYNNLSAEQATTTIEFAEGDHSVDINKSISVKAILKANDAEVSDATVSYSSSNDKIATVDENGNITGVAGGKTTITASFAGNDYYKEATSVNYDVEVTDPNVITVFYESFDKFNSVGGNDGKFDQSSTAVLTNLNDADNSGWTFENSVFEANKCLRIAASKKNGAIKTPQINLSGDATLTFKVGAWSKKKTSGAVIVTITNGKLSYNGKEAPTQTIDIPDAKFGDLSMNIVGATYGMTIKFESATNKDNQFFLDEVKITAPKPGELTLGEGNNDKVLDEAIKETDKLFNVTLNQTMQADGGWYTFSVPFDIADVSTTPLKDAEIRQYKSMTGSIMNFEATTSLKAVHAYLVKPTTDIANPVFQNVTVSLGDNVVDGADGYEFVGIYSDRRLETDGTNLFLGADNKFYVPTSDDCTLKALRGYFVAPSADSGAKMSIDIDGNTTSISALNSGKAIMNGRVYNLNGQYVGKDVKALQKGIYMVNGKKYIVK